MIVRKNIELLNEFSRKRRVCSSPTEEVKQQKPKNTSKPKNNYAEIKSKGREFKVPPKNQQTKPVGERERFLRKLEDFSSYVDSFTTKELVFYFIQIADNCGYKYVPSYTKDMSIFKRLNNDFTNVEICAMIEFLYQSEQDYLDKERLTPNILASRWVNTIYADMKLWIDDKYVPKSKQVKKKFDTTREWSKTEESEDKPKVIIGGML